MTIDEAKEAVFNRTPVYYKGVPWIPTEIVSWYQDHGFDRGWRNSFTLICPDGIRSCTRALVRDCSLEPEGALTA